MRLILTGSIFSEFSCLQASHTDSVTSANFNLLETIDFPYSFFSLAHGFPHKSAGSQLQHDCGVRGVPSKWSTVLQSNRPNRGSSLKPLDPPLVAHRGEHFHSCSGVSIVLSLKLFGLSWFCYEFSASEFVILKLMLNRTSCVMMVPPATPDPSRQNHAPSSTCIL